MEKSSERDLETRPELLVEMIKIKEVKDDARNSGSDNITTNSNGYVGINKLKYFAGERNGEIE